MQSKFKHSARLLIVALTLLAFTLAPQVQAQNTSTFVNLIARKLTVLQSAVFSSDVTVAGNAAVTGAITGASITTTGIDTAGTFRIDVAATPVAVTPGGTVTPLGSYQPITAAASGTGTSTIAGCASGTAGERVTFVNTSANTITFTDTGTLKLSGNAALGQYDDLILICDGTNWIQTGKTDN